MKILIIDAYNMIHRARHSFGSGEYSTVFNFFRSVKSEIDRHSPDLVYLVSEGHPRHRLALNEDYKAHRPSEVDEAFLRQKREIFELSEKFPFIFIRHPNYECDDVIGYLCEALSSEDDIVILSSDTDFIQLLEKGNISLWNPIKKKFIERWPVDYVTWKALKGDPADNVKGIRGIGAKRAFSLCEDLDILRQFLDADTARRDIFESAKAQIRLADIQPDCALWEIVTNRFNEATVKSTFTEYRFKSIIGKAWKKWKTTMEILNDKLQANIDASTTGDPSRKRIVI